MGSNTSNSTAVSPRTGAGAGEASDPTSPKSLHPPPEQDVNLAACELYKLSGDISAMRKLGCPGIPSGSFHGRLKTIPVHSERGSSMDESISNMLKYVMLGVLLFIATMVMLTCCCRMYARITSRRRALYNAFRARTENPNNINRNIFCGGSGVRPNFITSRSGCCGGVIKSVPPRVYTYRSPYLDCIGSKKTAMHHQDPNDCADCAHLNTV